MRESQSVSVCHATESVAPLAALALRVCTGGSRNRTVRADRPPRAASPAAESVHTSIYKRGEGRGVCMAGSTSRGGRDEMYSEH